MDFEALPLFPLHAVVFPGLPLQLQVFEERYKALVADVMARDQRFGVAAIASGVEVGGTAAPFMVGTLAQIVSVDLQDDGRVNLLASGVERIKLLSLEQGGKPYMRASAALWPDDPQPVASHHEVISTQDAVNLYIAAIMREIGSSEEEISRRVPLTLPDDPLTLSIIVAGMIQVPLREKQDLLEARSSGERIDRELHLLNRELLLLRSAHAGPAVQPLGLNGMFSVN